MHIQLNDPTKEGNKIDPAMLIRDGAFEKKVQDAIENKDEQEILRQQLQDAQDAELKAASGAEQPPQPAAKAPEKPPEPPAIDIEAIKAKLESEQVLTPEEQAAIKDFTEAPLKSEDAKPVNIGGIEYSKAQVTEMALKEVGIVDASVLTADQLDKITSMFVDQKHKAEWQKSQTRKSQEIAETRKEVGRVAYDLLLTQKQVRSQIEDLRITRELLAKRAQSNVTQETVLNDSGSIDPLKMRELTKKLDAQEELPVIDARLQKLENESNVTETKLIVQQYKDFQEQHPEYQTSRDVVEIAANIKEIPSNNIDKIKVIEMMEIFRTSSLYGISPEDVYAARSNTGTRTVKPEADSTVAQSIASAVVKEGNKKLLDEIKRRQSMGVVFKSGNSRGAPAPKKPLSVLGAETIRAATMNQMKPGTMESMDAYNKSMSFDDKLAKAGY